MAYRSVPMALRRHGATLTPRQQDIFVAVVNAGSLKAAAHELGMSRAAVSNALLEIREELGAETTAHAAALTFAMLGDRFLPDVSA